MHWSVFCYSFSSLYILGKCQNISLIISAVFFQDALLHGVEIFMKSNKKYPNIICKQKIQLMITMHPEKIMAEIGEIF